MSEGLGDAMRYIRLGSFAAELSVPAFVAAADLITVAVVRCRPIFSQ